MNKKKVLIFSSSPLHNGPRYIREIEALKEKYTVIAVGLTPPHDNSIFYFPFSQFDYSFIDKVIRKLYKITTGCIYKGKLPIIKQRIHKLLENSKPDIVIIHNPTHLPYFLGDQNKKYKVIFNAHEYHPLEFDENKKWMNLWGKYLYFLYRKYLPQVDLLINVCQSIADKCEQEFEKMSVVIPNAAAYQSNIHPTKSPVNFPIRIIHHGGAIPERKIEIMIEAVQMLGDNYQLDLMLSDSNNKYYHELLRLTKKTNNVRIIKPLPFDKIISFINQYDIGLYNLPAISFNNRVALPNKLFEFIQARLCIVLGPSPEMKNIVQQNNLGIVSNDFTVKAIAEAIKSLSFDDIQRYKHNADQAAFDLSADKYMSKFLDAIKTI